MTTSVEPLTSAKPPGGSVEVALYSTVSDEITAVVDQIRRIRDAGEIPLKQIAILVRPFIPDAHFAVLKPADVGVPAQKPQQLDDD